MTGNLPREIHDALLYMTWIRHSRKGRWHLPANRFNFRDRPLCSPYSFRMQSHCINPPMDQRCPTCVERVVAQYVIAKMTR